MYMKKIKLAGIGVLLLGSITVVSCGEGNGKNSAEDDVRNYGKYFVEKLNAGELDSLSSTFPDIVKADSLSQITTDTILVSEKGPGQYIVTLTDGVSLNLKRSEDGTLSVESSKGLFVFSPEKIDVARKTGMVTDSLNDVQTAEKLKDEDFFAYIKKTYSSSEPYKIKVTPGKLNQKYSDYAEGWTSTMKVTLQNLSSEPISGADYTVSYKSKEWGGGSANPKSITKSLSANGIDLGPNASGSITISRNDADKFLDFKIVPAVGKEEALLNKSTFTGNEYQDYLNSKK